MIKLTKDEIERMKISEKEDKYVKYVWYNVRNVGQLRESLTLIPDNTEIDIDLRYVENLTKIRKNFNIKSQENQETQKH